jgi:hypothetical protein
VLPSELAAIFIQSAEIDDLIYQTPVLPKNCIYCAELYNGAVCVVMEREKCRRDLKYHNTLFKEVGFPKLVFGVVVKNGEIIKTMLCAATDYLIKPESQLYLYPFSNVYRHNLEICWGTYQMHSITEPYQVSSLLDVFLSLEMNDHLYPHTGNKPFRELLQDLEGKDFDDGKLLKPVCKFADFLKMLFKEEVLL